MAIKVTVCLGNYILRFHTVQCQPLRFKLEPHRDVCCEDSQILPEFCQHGLANADLGCLDQEAKIPHPCLFTHVLYLSRILQLCFLFLALSHTHTNMHSQKLFASIPYLYLTVAGPL